MQTIPREEGASTGGVKERATASWSTLGIQAPAVHSW